MTGLIRNIFDGACSTLDILPPHRPFPQIAYLHATNSEKSALSALYKDWERIGADLSKVIQNEKRRCDSEK